MTGSKRRVFTKVAYLRDSVQDRWWHGGETAVTVQGHSAKTVEAYLAARLKFLREEPEEALRQMEEETLAGLSSIARSAGAEHTKTTGRQAGGGRLVKGS